MIEVGSSYTVETTVDESNVASMVGSGTLKVFATPAMIAQMELAAERCISGALEEGQSSVGTVVQVEHLAATPIGGKITTTATVTAVDGKQVSFEVIARDDIDVVGRGTHTRFVVDVARFMAKAQSRGGAQG